MPPSRKEAIERAMGLRAAGRNHEAADAWALAVDVSPDDPILYHNWASTLGDIGQSAAAIEVLETGFKKGLDAPQSLLVYARALLGAHQPDAAVSAYDRLLVRAPFDDIAHREYAQMVWMLTADRDKALERLSRAIDLAPQAMALQLLRGQLCGQMDALQEEYTYLCAAIARFGPHPILDHAACKSALANGDSANAVTHGRRVFENAAGEERARSVYCTALIANDELSAAQDLLDSLRRDYPVNQYYIALQATIWRLQEDERWRALFDLDALTFQASLSVPNGWSRLDDYLDDLSAALDERHRFSAHPFFQSVRNGSQISSITEEPDPAMRAYGEAIQEPVREFLRRIGSGDDPIRTRNNGSADLFSAWSVSLPPGGSHVNHVHPEGWISSACHIRFDGQGAEAETHSGYLKFGEPGILTPRPLPPEKFVEPRRGVLVLFPSYLWHGVVPYSGAGARLTVAADLTPSRV